MVDDRTEMLIRRNRALLARAAKGREEAREATALAEKHIAMLTRALARLRHPRTVSNESAQTISWC
jgi:hypothetical protein